MNNQNTTTLSLWSALTLVAMFTSGLFGSVAEAQTIETYISPPHTFSTDDVLGDFAGTVVADDEDILCGLVQSCPADGEQPFVDQEGVTLYPIDSTFAFDVIDFLGATPKERDGVYSEGFIGDLPGDAGVRVSNAATLTLKAGNPKGTWCGGLGGNNVKCSSEHFTVMEHVLSCYETVPYFYADPETGEQMTVIHPVTGELIEPCQPLNVIPDEHIAELEPNENSVVEDIVVGTDYSVTLKDDGKPLYRWGTLVKRPSDVRLYAQLPLPEPWNQPQTRFQVLSAQLIVQHQITNNPNDQLRPEDFENEAATGSLPPSEPGANRATGRQPEVIELPDGTLISARDCYEGDGDFIAAGTVLLHPDHARPGAPSSDLRLGLTNAWYTTTDRDPFEGDPVSGSGPRWRLKSNKFGQDIPGLEIPALVCSPPPFSHGNIKYEVGEFTTTIINLLDWAPDGQSPLAWSDGWIAYLDAEDGAVDGLSINGLPLSQGFDLGVYIKGEGKPTTLYNAQIAIQWNTFNTKVFTDGFESGDTLAWSATVIKKGP